MIEERSALTVDITGRTGVDARMTTRLVHGFYAQVRAGALLGPVFDAHIRDWDAHLARMCAFWSSVALMSGDYHGNPMGRHPHLPVDARHFDRWLALFEASAAALCPPVAAAHFVERARRIAQSLELGIASRHGVRLGRGQRFHRDAVVPASEGVQQ